MDSSYDDNFFKHSDSCAILTPSLTSISSMMSEQGISESEVDFVFDELLQDTHNNDDLNINTITTTTGAYGDNVTSDATLNTGVTVTTSTTTADDTTNVQQRGAGARDMLDFVTNYSNNETESTAIPFSNVTSALVVSTATQPSLPSLTMQNGFILHRTNNFEPQQFPKCKYFLISTSNIFFDKVLVEN